MTHATRTLVAVDEGVDMDALQSILPIDPEIQIVGVVDGLEDSWTTLQETPTDLIVVACADSSDRALFLVDGAVKQRPERPVVVVCDGSPNGFVQRVFDAGCRFVSDLDLEGSCCPGRCPNSCQCAEAMRRTRWLQAFLGWAVKDSNLRPWD